MCWVIKWDNGVNWNDCDQIDWKVIDENRKKLIEFEEVTLAKIKLKSTNWKSS